MAQQGTWRISTAYDYISELDAPDLAWEFLRRNPEYRQDHERLKADPKAESAFSQRWGLSFRHRPFPSGDRRTARMDANRRSMDPRPPVTTALASAGATG